LDITIIGYGCGRQNRVSISGGDSNLLFYAADLRRQTRLGLAGFRARRAALRAIKTEILSAFVGVGRRPEGF
jgi:hypothetical protein